MNFVSVILAIVRARGSHAEGLFEERSVVEGGSVEFFFYSVEKFTCVTAKP